MSNKIANALLGVIALFFMLAPVALLLWASGVIK